MRRPNGAGSLRRSDSIQNNRSAGPRSRITVAQTSESPEQVQSDFAPKLGRQEQNFWMQRQAAKNRL
jgi:hypothetical protein